MIVASSSIAAARSIQAEDALTSPSSSSAVEVQRAKNSRTCVVSNSCVLENYTSTCSSSHTMGSYYAVISCLNSQKHVAGWV